MKPNFSTKNSLLWGVLALVVGLLITFNPFDTLELAIQLSGLILLIFGVIQLLTFLGIRKRANLSWSALPFGGVIGLIFGIILMVSPLIFQAFFMYMLGIFIIFLGIWQISSLVQVGKAGAKVAWSYYIFPVLLIISGVIIFMFPIATSAWIVIFAGLWIAAFGLVEIIAYFTLKLPQTTDKK